MPIADMRGTQTWNLFMKNCICILPCLNFNHLQSTLHWCNTPIETVFPLLKRVLNSLILMPFSAYAIFCFTSSTLAKHLPLKTFFIWGNKKKVTGWDWVNRELGHGGHAIFGQKLMNTQHTVSQCTHKSPIVKWANALKESSKEIHLSQTQPLTTPPAGTLIHMGF